jgi:uncharacterized protein YprB with RNaseH-like and TPR domain
MPSLSERLKSLGVKIGTSDLPAPNSFDQTQGKLADHYGIDSVVSGSYRQTPLGDVFVAEQTYGPDHRHGETPLLSAFSLSVISQWANDARMSSLPIEQFAFLDTETSGLSGGTGTYAFLVGVGRFISGKFILQQFFMRDPAEEPALLEGLAQFIAPCASLVTFNGKAFDAPLLATRYAMHHIPVPFKNYSHLDLLPLARRLWRDRLPSRALKYIEEHILGLTRSDDEVPGYEIPWLYFDYLRTGDARPLAGVFYHNAMDVVAMAALLAHVNNMLMDPYGGHVHHGLDFISLGKLFDDLRKWDEAARLFERGLESQLTEAEFGLAMERLSILQKKRGDLSHAVQLWQSAAEQGHIYAHVELAKYYEHKQRDIKSALKWANAARKHIDMMDAPAYMRAHWQAEIDYRLARLERKAGI